MPKETPKRNNLGEHLCSTVEDVASAVGNIISNVKDVHYCNGDIISTVKDVLVHYCNGDIISTVKEFTTVGDIISTVKDVPYCGGDIISNIEDSQYCVWMLSLVLLMRDATSTMGDMYHQYCEGCSALGSTFREICWVIHNSLTKGWIE